MYYAMMNYYFRIIRPIPSRTDEKFVEIQDISGHLKSLTDFTIQSKKLLNVLAITSIFRTISSTIAQLHSTKPELRFCSCSNPARGVSEIHDGKA